MSEAFIAGLAVVSSINVPVIPAGAWSSTVTSSVNAVHLAIADGGEVGHHHRGDDAAGARPPSGWRARCWRCVRTASNASTTAPP